MEFSFFLVALVVVLIVIVVVFTFFGKCNQDEFINEYEVGSICSRHVVYQKCKV
jgi:hypothetical protein